MTIEEEWPRIRGTLDGNHPAAIGLVTVSGTDPSMLGMNHQVLAYAYDEVPHKELVLHLYNPNTDRARGDTIHLRMPLNHPEHTTHIDHNVNIATHAGAKLPIRGFFQLDYHPSDPRTLEFTPQPKLPALKVTVTPHPLPWGST